MTSDFHGELPRDVQPCDLLVVAGDVGFSHSGRIGWLMTEFWDWLLRQPAEVIVGVAGNLDWGAEDHPEAMRALPWVYLEDSAADVLGVKVWGSPRSKQFNDGSFMDDDDALTATWAEIPDDTEVLIVHGPAKGILDEAHGKHVGSVSLANRIRELPDLKLLVTGHIHEAYGYCTVSEVMCVNASYMGAGYRPGNPPITVLLDGVTTTRKGDE